MTYLEIEKSLSELQNNEELFSVKMEGWPLWSIIKSQLFLRCSNRFVSKRRETYLSKVLRLRHLIFRQLFNYFIAILEWQIVKYTYRGRPNVPLALFFFFGGHRFKNLSGKMEHPFGENLIINDRRRFDVFVIERTKGFSRQKVVPYKRDLREDIIVFPGYMGFNCSRKNCKEIKIKLHELFNIIEKIIKDDQKELLVVIKEEMFSKLIFRTACNFIFDKKKASKILKRLRPKMIFLTASSGQLGTIGAAKELQIPVVEIQHGVFNEFYTVYQWPIFYRDRKTELLVPDKIFMWGQYWIDVQKRLGFWRRSDLVLYGNPKMTLFKSKLIGLREENKQLVISQNRINILYTSSSLYRQESILYLENLLNTSICRGLPIYINIKLHPYEDEEYQFYKEALVDKYPLNCKVNYHLDKPLYDYFIDSDLHLSVVSAAIFESIEIGLPTVIINNEGREYYSDIVKKGILKYTKTNEDIIKIINSMILKDENWECWNNKIIKSRNYFFSEPEIIKIVDLINKWVQN